MVCFLCLFGVGFFDCCVVVCGGCFVVGVDGFV